MERFIPMEEITIRDVAQICGVGVSTVSRAINNHPDISPETRQMVMQVIKEHNYIPNNSARNLKRQTAKAIAVLVKGIDNSFFHEMIRDIEEEIKKRKYTMVLQHVKSSEDEVNVALQLVKEKRLKGIIFLGGCFVHNEEKLSQLQVPFVLSTAGAVALDERKVKYCSVSVDDEKESYRLVNYLIQAGHRDIAIICEKAERDSISTLRLEGYKRALKEHQIPIRQELILTMRPEIQDYSLENGYAVTEEFIRKKIPCSALYAISDIMAIGAQKALADAGFRIPEDISLVGFDGVKIGNYMTPSLTTLKQPAEEMAQETARLMFEMITQKVKGQHKIFEGELVLRQSTRAI